MSDLNDALIKAEAQLHRFLILQPHCDTALTLWAAATHLGRESDYFPRLAVCAATHDAGKTTTLDVLMGLCREAKIYSGLTGASLFRNIDMTLSRGATYLLDEGENLGIQDNDVLRAVLNAGVGGLGPALVTRCTGEDFVPTDFDVRGWLAIAKIGAIEPASLRSRCIVINMARALVAPPELLGLPEYAEVQAVGLRLGQAVDANVAALRSTRPILPGQLLNRNAQKWRRLTAIADVAGEAWPERVRAAAIALIEDDTETDVWGVSSLILDAMETVYALGQDPIPLDTLKLECYTVGLGQEVLEPTQRLGMHIAALGLKSYRVQAGNLRYRVLSRQSVRLCLDKHGRKAYT